MEKLLKLETKKVLTNLYTLFNGVYIASFHCSIDCVEFHLTFKIHINRASSNSCKCEIVLRIAELKIDKIINQGL